jgi:opacity protein-like surface antigen
MLQARAARIALTSAAFMVAAGPAVGQDAGAGDRISPLFAEGLDLRLDLDDVYPGQVPPGEPDSPDSGEDLPLLAARDTNWTIDIQPYVWVPLRIDGDSTVNGFTAPLDMTLSDLFDTFDPFGLTLRIEAWNEDGWGLIFDGMYARVDGDEVTGSSAVPQVDVEVEQGIVDFGLGLRVFDEPIGSGDTDLRLVLDLLGGPRVQILRQDITLSPGPDLGDDKAWVEPFIGGRVSLLVGERWAFVVRGDASGFGIGDASDLTWNLLAGAGYRFTDLFELNLGYRFLSIDYEDGSGFSRFGLDALMHGPWLGASFRF